MTPHPGGTLSSSRPGGVHGRAVARGVEHGIHVGVLPVSLQPASNIAHRLTRRGQTVLEVLRDAAAHLDAYQVYRLARRRHPRLSLSTVYRTLAVLRDEGLVRELHLGHEHYHYEYAAGSGRHDHFHLVCRACGRVVEFVSPLLVELGRELHDAHGFLVNDLEVEITATCGACPALTTSAE